MAMGLVQTEEVMTERTAVTNNKLGSSSETTGRGRGTHALHVSWTPACSWEEAHTRKPRGPEHSPRPSHPQDLG